MSVLPRRARLLKWWMIKPDLKRPGILQVDENTLGKKSTISKAIPVHRTFWENASKYGFCIGNRSNEK